MTGSYLTLLKSPGAKSFVIAGFIGRLPLSMISLGIVLFITDLSDSYALAGAMSATFALSAALIGPFGARLIDRFGQDRVGWILGAVQVVSLLAFVAAASAGLSLWLQIGLLVICGGVAPNLGSMVRARWAHQLSGQDLLTSAFALEAVVDELVYIVGPLLAVALALNFGPGSALLVSAGLVAIGSTWLSLQRATQPEVSRYRSATSRARIVGAPMVVVFIIMLLLGGIFGSFEVTTVAFTRDLGQESATGLVLAVFAVGSLISGLTLGAIQPTRGPGRQLLTYTGLLAFVVLPIPFVQSIPMLVGVAFVAGLSVSPVLIATVSYVEVVVPAGRLTEALTVSISGVLIGLAIASTLSGMIADSAAPALGYVVMTGCGMLAWGVAIAARGILRDSA